MEAKMVQKMAPKWHQNGSLEALWAALGRSWAGLGRRGRFLSDFVVGALFPYDFCQSIASQAYLLLPVSFGSSTVVLARYHLTTLRTTREGHRAKEGIRNQSRLPFGTSTNLGEWNLGFRKLYIPFSSLQVGGWPSGKSRRRAHDF